MQVLGAGALCAMLGAPGVPVPDPSVNQSRDHDR